MLPAVVKEVGAIACATAATSSPTSGGRWPPMSPTLTTTVSTPAAVTLALNHSPNAEGERLRCGGGPDWSLGGAHPKPWRCWRWPHLLWEGAGSTEDGLEEASGVSLTWEGAMRTACDPAIIHAPGGAWAHSHRPIVVFPRACGRCPALHGPRSRAPMALVESARMAASRRRRPAVPPWAPSGSEKRAILDIRHLLDGSQLSRRRPLRTPCLAKWAFMARTRLGLTTMARSPRRSRSSCAWPRPTPRGGDRSSGSCSPRTPACSSPKNIVFYLMRSLLHQRGRGSTAGSPCGRRPGVARVVVLLLGR